MTRARVALSKAQRRQAMAEDIVARWQRGEMVVDIAKAVGISRNAVACKLSLLRRSGVPLVKRKRGMPPLDLGALSAVAERNAPAVYEPPDRPYDQAPGARVTRCGCGAVLLPREVSAHVCEVRR
jgi:hypothetical protein